MRCDAGHGPAWLFDMDNTLHDASWQIFPRMNAEMTAYIQRQLGVDPAEANRMRWHFWRRYGATLLGLMREHGVKATHFLAETHRFPELPSMLRADPSQRAAIARLAGRKWVLTNAPRDYALRVLRQLKLLKLFEGVISIEDMRQFGRLRPKPDARMLRHVLRRHRLRPAQCVLVEDTLQHLKSARRLGLHGAWFTRYDHRGLRRQPHRAAEPRTCRGRPAYVRAKISSLWRLRSLIPR